MAIVKSYLGTNIMESTHPVTNTKYYFLTFTKTKVSFQTKTPK